MSKKQEREERQQLHERKAEIEQKIYQPNPPLTEKQAEELLKERDQIHKALKRK